MKAFTRREALASFLGIAGAAVLPGCSVNPVTGKREFMLMSERQEIALGEQAHGEILQTYGTYKDESVQSWFDERGQEMSKLTHRSQLKYTFVVLDSPVVNAFAVPGGFIYVTRGILGYFNNEAQFAGVLAHEFGHVNARHSAAKYSKAQVATITLGVGSIFSEEFAKYAQFASVGMQLMFLKFSRDDERQADKLGVEYSSKNGYDAVEMSAFFGTLERMHPGGGSLPEWQSTHPDPGDRINNTRKQAQQFQKSNPDMKYLVKRNEYMELIDGMIFGNDPRQGYIKDNMFYHPEMKFTFPVPPGWTLSNNPSEVRMSPEKNNAVSIFTVSPGDTPQAAGAQFTTDNGVTVTSSRSLSVNSMDGYNMSGLISSEDAKIAITSYFIKKGDVIFAFHGLSAETDFGAYKSAFDMIAVGFDNLTDQSLINVSPEKIELRELKNNLTFRSALNDFGVPEDQIENLAIINGMEIDDVVKTGTKIKIIG
ncbi:M48 family metalloprotease [Candidatus Latescibacterota bacterium]